ncbi:hypothetical protein JCGZ_13280 [Jatropha curcas]|uniref:Uncharacterized protein n=1 Tax=Jatropha curcas TaxID=180498 RepID=A0A067KJB9_JATCU|nr:hypothetical protein JCGZ_13280 [Jatropha curcas]
MAANILPLNSVTIRARAGPGSQRPDPHGRKSSSSSGNWWSPLFGWSSEADYIGSENKPQDMQEKEDGRSESDLSSKPVRSRFAPGGFTEEKARQLRMMTNETSSFHDVMYHSAIASRLASDFKHRSER